MAEQPTLIPVICPNCGSGIDTSHLHHGDPVKCAHCGQNFIFNNPTEPHNNREEESKPERKIGCLEYMARAIIGILGLSAIMLEFAKWIFFIEMPFVVAAIGIFTFVVAVLIQIAAILTGSIENNEQLVSIIFFLGYSIHQIFFLVFGVNLFISIGIAIVGMIALEWIIILILKKITGR